MTKAARPGLSHRAQFFVSVPTFGLAFLDEATALLISTDLTDDSLMTARHVCAWFAARVHRVRRRTAG